MLKKRILALCLVITLLIAALPVCASAEDAEPEDTRSSAYLDMYSAILSTSTTGHLKVTDLVYATDYMSAVGVFSITVRNNDGTIHQIIWGSTANGLLKANAWYHGGTYTLNLVSGNTYYCTVKIIARDANGGDTRTVTTAHVTCP